MSMITDLRRIQHEHTDYHERPTEQISLTKKQNRNGTNEKYNWIFIVCWFNFTSDGDDDSNKGEIRLFCLSVGFVCCPFVGKKKKFPSFLNES